MKTNYALSLLTGLLFFTGCGQEVKHEPKQEPEKIVTKTFTFKHMGCGETFERIGISYEIIHIVDCTLIANVINIKIKKDGNNEVEYIGQCPACGKRILEGSGDNFSLLKERLNN